MDPIILGALEYLQLWIKPSIDLSLGIEKIHVGLSLPLEWRPSSMKPTHIISLKLDERVREGK
jgi:hypothetical protein